MNETISGILYIGSGLTPDITLSNTVGINTSFNANKQNIDFSILGTGNNSLVYFDASAGRLGIGTGLPDAVLHVVAPCSKDGLIIESITNCPTGVTLLLVHNPQTAPQSGSYPAIINLAGRDTNYGEIAYAQIMSRILDPVTGFTSGELIFTVDETGINKPVFTANLQNVILGGRNQISGYNYEVIGSRNAITGVGFTNIGSYNSGLSTSGILIGNLNDVNGLKILALVNNADILGNNNVVLGDRLSLSGTSNILIGNSNQLSGSYNVLIGGNNELLTSYTVGLTQNAMSSGISGIVLGSYINNTGNYNIYIGNVNNLSGNNNSIVGSYVNLTGTNTVVYGSSDNVSGNSLILIGSNQSVINVNSGIFIGNNITSQDSYRSVIVGLGNSIQSGLQDSILVGINNNLSSGNPSSLLLVGQANTTKDITGSLIIGNTNNLSGTVANNLVLGSTNAVPAISNNNLVLGVLNNQTGVYIDSAGSVSGTPRRTSGSVNNSILAGINNIITNGNSDILLGNKNSISGSNANILGSYNNLKNSSNTYNIGNSNFIVGDKIGTLGSKISVIGQESVVLNTANSKMDVFGSGNIVIGYNAAVSSGIIVGTANKTHGINNIIYGKNNTVGSIRHQFTTDSQTTFTVTVPSLNVSNKYNIGDTVLIYIQNPPSATNTFIREILDIVEDSLNTLTTITFTNSISIDNSNGYYSINNAFDDNNPPASAISGLIMPYQQGGGIGGPETNPTYGSDNIIVGSNNNYIFSSGIVVGNNNTVSGVKNIVIGYGISGVANNTLYLGTNNRNKIILDNEKMVFNSGAFQDNFIIKSSNDNTSIVNVDLNNNYFGINTNSPTADLSVSGLTSTDTIRVGFSAPDQYVLTTNTNGYGTWQLPVRISGTDNGLMYRVNNKVASGINQIQYNPTTSTMGFNLDGNNGFYITSSGLLVNDEGNIYGMRVRGSGGTDFAKTLLETNFSKNRIDFYNVSGNSGNFGNFSVSGGMILPVSLTGTFLYVDNSGKLNAYNSRAYSVLFSNGNSWATGDTSYRWFNNQSILAMGSTGVVTYDEITASGGNFDTRYNILLSSNRNIDTVFNNLGLGNNFSVLVSGQTPGSQRRGFHVASTGVVIINSSSTDTNASGNSLYVRGKTWTNSLRLGEGSTVSGLYLRVDGGGNVFSSLLDLNTQFSGFYPLATETTSLGQDNAFRVDIKFSDKDRSNNAIENGGFLIFNGNSWNLASGIKIDQSPSVTNQLKTLNGIEFGHKAKMGYTYHTHAFASSSFLDTNTVYDGSSQFAQYYLRCRTLGSTIVELTTDWAKNNATTHGRDNTISLLLNTGNSDLYDNVWNYKILVSAIWQSGTSVSGVGPRSGAGITIEGAILRSSDGSIFTKLGNETITTYSAGLPAGMGIATRLDTADQTTIPRLSIVATGVAGQTTLWSATAQINQLNYPASYNLFGNT